MTESHDHQIGTFSEINLEIDEFASVLQETQSNAPKETFLKRGKKVFLRGVVFFALLSALQRPEDGLSLGNIPGAGKDALTGFAKLLASLRNVQVQQLTQDEFDQITGGLSLDDLTAPSIPSETPTTGPESTEGAATQPTLSAAEQMIAAFSAPPGFGTTYETIPQDTEIPVTPIPPQATEIIGLSPTPIPTETPESETGIEESLLSEESVENESLSIVEYALEPYMESIYINRLRRLGRISWLGSERPRSLQEAQNLLDDPNKNYDLPPGWKLIEKPGPFGYDIFAIPDDTDPRFEYVYNPRNVAKKFGIKVNSSDWYEQYDSIEAVANSERVNFLIMGLDTRPEDHQQGLALTGRADAMIVASIDTNTGAIALITLARDLQPPEIRRTLGGVDPELSTVAWVYKDSQGNNVPIPDEFARAVVEDATGLFIDGMVKMDFEVVKDLIDALYPNGFTYELEEDIHRQEASIDNLELSPGTYQVDGDLAVKLIRARKGLVNNSETRQSNLREIATAMIQSLINEVKSNPVETLAGISQRIQAFQEVISQAEINAHNLAVRQQVFPGETPPAPLHNPDYGYIQQMDLAVRPLDIFVDLLNLDSGMDLAALVIDNPQNRAYLDWLQSGEGLISVGVGYDEVNSGNSYYWEQSRRKIADALGFEPAIPGSVTASISLEAAVPTSTNEPTGDAAHSVSTETPTLTPTPEATPSATATIQPQSSIELVGYENGNQPVSRLVLEPQDDLFSWMESDEGLFADLDLPNSEVNFILDYVRKQGVILASVRSEAIDLTAEKALFYEAHHLYELAFPEGMGVAAEQRTPLGQLVINSQYKTEEEKFAIGNDWHEFISTLDPETQTMLRSLEPGELTEERKAEIIAEFMATLG